MFKIESYKRGIILSTLFNIFNKGIVFLTGLLIAYFFGANKSTDLYFFIYNAIALLGAYFISMNSSVIIPESMRIRTEQGNAEATNFLNFFIILYSSFMFICIVLIAIQPISFFSLISNFDYQQLKDSTILLYLSLPLFLLVTIINFFSDILASNKFFTTPMIVGIVNGIITILSVIFLHDAIGVKSIFYGLLLSHIINLVILISLMIKKLGWQFSIKKVQIPSRIWKNIGFAQLGNLTSTLSAYAPFYILSGFPTGIITSLTFAQQISSLPATLIINQFSSVAGLKFNELYYEKKYEEMNRAFTSTANFLLFIAFPISGILFLFPYQIINLFFNHGKFDENSLQTAALFLKYLGLLLPLIVINTLFARLFMASHKIKQSFWYQAILNTIFIAAIYVFISKIGILGYPISALIIYFVNVLFCYFLEKYYFNIINYRNILMNFLLFLGISIIISTCTYYIVIFSKIKSDFGVILIGSVSYLILTVAIAFKLKLNATFSVFIMQLMQKLRLQ